MELLRFPEESSPQKLANVFTGDKSWFYLYNPRNSMWLASGVPRSTRVRRNIWARKVMIWICFPSPGSYDMVMLPHGEKFNRGFLIDEVLERYDEHRIETRETNQSYSTFCILTRPVLIWFNRNLTRWVFINYLILLIVSISHYAIFGFSDTLRWSSKRCSLIHWRYF
jgi:hypothetical protein